MDRWDGGDDYELFMGRWSSLIAERFLDALPPTTGGRWLDVGCGTGALLNAVLQRRNPDLAVGVEPSAEFTATARRRFGAAATVEVADGASLPFDDDSFEVVVSGLALNFMPDPVAAVSEWQRVSALGGTISAYVWDYTEGMQFLRSFWDAAISMDPTATSLDEAHRFPLCQPGPLEDTFRDAGLGDVAVDCVQVPTVFADFDDFWNPFLLGQGPAPSYVAGLSSTRMKALEERLRVSLPVDDAGRIPLIAKAWTVTGSALSPYTQRG